MCLGQITEQHESAQSALRLRSASIRLSQAAVACLWIGICAGVIGALSYTPLAELLARSGFSLKMLRPVHLLAGTGWVYLAGLAVVIFYWSRCASSAEHDRKRLRAVRFFLASWGLGAVVVAISLLGQRFGGREYFFASVPASALFWIGWVPLAWTFLREGGEPAHKRPAYVWMWTSSFGLFTYAFLETHVFLLPYFQSHPLRDMAVEWKSYGTLVGSFNLLVYAALGYVGEQLNPASNYGRSRLAFALFWVGILNSFTNYGHHTFHLPQSSIVKWASFCVSMTETLILAKVIWDVRGWALRYRKEQRWDGLTWLLVSAAGWTFANLVLSIAISIPPVNALIHGTYVVAAHAMGSMLGIDTLALLAVLTWMQRERGGADAPRWAVAAANGGMFVLWASFLGIGIGDSLRRWNAGVLPSASQWPGWFGLLFVGGGMAIAVGVVALTQKWLFGRKAEAANSPQVVATVEQACGLREHTGHSRDTRLGMGDHLFFASIGQLLLFVLIAACAAGRLASAEGWLWAQHVVEARPTVWATLLSAIGLAIAWRGLRPAGHGERRRGHFGIAAAAGVLAGAVLLGQLWQLRQRGLSIGTEFHPHPRYVATVLGVAAPSPTDFLEHDSVGTVAENSQEARPNGRRLYRATCASCHGQSGEGLPGLGVRLQQNPMVAGLESEFVQFVRAGRAANDAKSVTRSAMPAKGGNPLLTDADLVAIQEHLRGQPSPLPKPGDKSADPAAAHETVSRSGEAMAAEEKISIPRASLPPAEQGPRGLSAAGRRREEGPTWRAPAGAEHYFAVYFGAIGLTSMMCFGIGVLTILPMLTDSPRVGGRLRRSIILAWLATVGLLLIAFGLFHF